MAPCLSPSPIIASTRNPPTMSAATVRPTLPFQVSFPSPCHGLLSVRNGFLFKEQRKQSTVELIHGHRNHQKEEKKRAFGLVVKAFSGKRGWDNGGGGGRGRTAAIDRVVAAVGYFLPLLDGMQYGRFLFAQFPAVEMVFKPLFPLLRLYSSIPYANFVVFFTIYLALVKNPSFPRYVRFNAMQACVVDVLIVIPLIVQRILNPKSGFGLDLLILFYNGVFVSLLVAVGFGMVSCVLGKTPRIPFVADAADNQLF